MSQTQVSLEELQQIHHGTNQDFLVTDSTTGWFQRFTNAKAERSRSNSNVSSQGVANDFKLSDLELQYNYAVFGWSEHDSRLFYQDTAKNNNIDPVMQLEIMNALATRYKKNESLTTPPEQRRGDINSMNDDYDPDIDIDDYYEAKSDIDIDADEHYEWITKYDNYQQEKAKQRQEAKENISNQLQPGQLVENNLMNAAITVYNAQNADNNGTFAPNVMTIPENFNSNGQYGLIDQAKQSMFNYFDGNKPVGSTYTIIFCTHGSHYVSLTFTLDQDKNIELTGLNTMGTKKGYTAALQKVVTYMQRQGGDEEERYTINYQGYRCIVGDQKNNDCGPNVLLAHGYVANQISSNGYNGIEDVRTAMVKPSEELLEMDSTGKRALAFPEQAIDLAINHHQWELEQSRREHEEIERNRIKPDNELNADIVQAIDNSKHEL